MGDSSSSRPHSTGGRQPDSCVKRCSLSRYQITRISLCPDNKNPQQLTVSCFDRQLVTFSGLVGLNEIKLTAVLLPDALLNSFEHPASLPWCHVVYKLKNKII